MDKIQIPQQHSHASFLKNGRQEPSMQNCHLFLHTQITGFELGLNTTKPVIVICPHVNEQMCDKYIYVLTLMIAHVFSPIYALGRHLGTQNLLTIIDDLSASNINCHHRPEKYLTKVSKSFCIFLFKLMIIGSSHQSFNVAAFTKNFFKSLKRLISNFPIHTRGIALYTMSHVGASQA